MGRWSIGSRKSAMSNTGADALFRIVAFCRGSKLRNKFHNNRA